LRTDTGVVKLADFGVAKVFAGRHLTATGGLVGTAEYVSPEQAAGKPVTPRSDLYSFGIVLYVLLTGQLPFEGDTVLDLMHKHRYGQFERPLRIVPELPYDIDLVICQLLEKDPSARPANAQILHRQLDQIRRKLDRKAQITVAENLSASTLVDDDEPSFEHGPGPATLAGRLVREELARQNQVGPIGQLLNHAWVLVLLLALCVGALAWGFWPPSADYLYEHGAELMAKPDLVDWEFAWEKYFIPLVQKHPDHPYGAQLQEFRQRLEDRRAETRAQRQAASGIALSEAQRFYVQGQRYKKDGNLLAAQQTWQNLVDVFQHVDTEQRWVRLAQAGLQETRGLLPPPELRQASVHAALEATKKMQREEAEKVWRGIEALYRDDPEAAAILRDVARYRAAR
jgi:serine/threonine-protein kinase